MNKHNNFIVVDRITKIYGSVVVVVKKTKSYTTSKMIKTRHKKDPETLKIKKLKNYLKS